MIWPAAVLLCRTIWLELCWRIPTTSIFTDLGGFEDAVPCLLEMEEEWNPLD